MRSARFRLLGGLQVIDGSGPVDLGTRKQRAVLAALLLGEGQVLSVGRLIEVLWGDEPPDRPEVSLQSYVSALRRVLEPDRAPRSAASVLVTRGAGYAVVTDRDQVDVLRFTDLVEDARHRQAAGDLPGADEALRRALSGYGTLLPEFEGEEFRDSAAHHLERLRTAALEMSYEVRLAMGEHRLLVSDLETAVRDHPLNEGMWALLALARYRAGRQAEALSAVADCRRILAEEIGVDPGPRLRKLEADILAHAPHLDAPEPAPTEVEHREAQRPVSPGGAGLLVGRDEELTVLEQALAEAAGGGHRVVLVEGEPGAGKTRLLEEASTAAAERGLTVVWGRCLDGGVAPAMWPWVQAVGQLLDRLDPTAREQWLAGELGHLLDPRGSDEASVTAIADSGAQFRMFELVAGVAEETGALAPVLLVIDDLQWADPASLQLFEHLAGRLRHHTVLVGALRDRAPTPNEQLTRTLAAISRLPGQHRLRLGPLAPDEVAALVAEETGREPDTSVARMIRERTGGNPFFVRELARLLRDAGELGANGLPAHAVPSGVRDVVRDRMSGLGAEARSLLQIAAVIGREVDITLLAGAASLDVHRCLELLEPVEELGLMSPTPRDPFSFQFAHDLVRESVAEATPTARTARLHLDVADAIEERPGRDPAAAAERLAHHLWSAGPLADRERTAVALVSAGRRALGKNAYVTAESHFRSAVELARSAGLDQLELDALIMLNSVMGVRLGYVGAVPEYLARAEDLARRTGQERLAADMLYSRWAAYSQGLRLQLSGPLAERLRDLGASTDDPVLQMYGGHAWGIHQWDLGNIGEAFRSLSKVDADIRQHVDSSEDNAALRYDLYLLSPAFLGSLTALHGDVQAGRALYDWMERELTAEPYGLTVWAAFASTTASEAGEAGWALEVARRGIEADPEFTFVFLGTYTRVGYWWARAVLGDDPVRAAGEIEALIDSIPIDPPRSGIARCYMLLADAELSAGRPERAGAALDRAEWCLDAYGQRTAEPLIMLTRARWLLATGHDLAAVRDLVDRARRLAVEREAFLFVRRADELEATLPVA